MSLNTDEIFYNALRTDTSIMRETKGEIHSTCIEVPPMEKDKTPLPYIIIMFDGGANDAITKDDFEGEEDNVTVSVEISAKSRKTLGRLAEMAREAIHRYLCNIDESAPDFSLRPDDYQISFSPVSWDWTKPCYFQTLTYQCSTKNKVHQNAQ